MNLELINIGVETICLNCLIGIFLLLVTSSGQWTNMVHKPFNKSWYYGWHNLQKYQECKECYVTFRGECPPTSSSNLINPTSDIQTKLQPFIHHFKCSYLYVFIEEEKHLSLYASITSIVGYISCLFFFHHIVFVIST